MAELHSKFIIVGAGLSGLTTAYNLLQNGEDDFIILEGRDRIGGRIKTKNGIDLGATWFQNYHSNLSELLDKLNIQAFDQYSTGKSVLVYNTMAPAHYFESDSSTPVASRIVGGSISLIDELGKSLHDKISLNTTVTDIAENEDTMSIQTDKGIFTCQKIIVTIPPKIACLLNFTPPLSRELIGTMEKTHTWMSNAIKVGITYECPFWRDKDLSGTVIGQISPVIELFDHSNSSGTTFSLMGFVNEVLRDESPESRKEIILSYLEKYLGNEVRDFTDYYEKDWSVDKYTNEELKSIYMSPQYGNPLFQNLYMNEKVLFSGAETSPVYGGYMEGAVYSGLNAAERLLNCNSHNKK